MLPKFIKYILQLQTKKHYDDMSYEISYWKEPYAGNLSAQLCQKMGITYKYQLSPTSLEIDPSQAISMREPPVMGVHYSRQEFQKS